MERVHSAEQEETARIEQASILFESIEWMRVVVPTGSTTHAVGSMDTESNQISQGRRRRCSPQQAVIERSANLVQPRARPSAPGLRSRLAWGGRRPQAGPPRVGVVASAARGRLRHACAGLRGEHRLDWFGASTGRRHGRTHRPSTQSATRHDPTPTPEPPAAGLTHRGRGPRAGRGGAARRNARPHRRPRARLGPRVPPAADSEASVSSHARRGATGRRPDWGRWAGAGHAWAGGAP
jgi:hypothetical protein